MPKAERANSMPRRVLRRAAVLGVCLAALAPASSLRAQLLLERDEVRELSGVDLVERLGARIPLDAVFTDADGQRAVLGEYFNDGRPTILALVYYDCPIVCNMVLDRLDEALNGLDYTIGEDYRLLVISFDHTESTTHALNRRDRSLAHYRADDRVAAREGMVFMTGDPVNIERLTAAVGWNFAPLPNGEWSHPVGLTVLSPEGMVSRYIYGFEYPPERLKLALLEATEGKIAKSLGERIMHYCFRYDPTAGAYSIQAMTLMRIGGVLTVVLLSVLIAALLVTERARVRRAARAGVGVNLITDLSVVEGCSRRTNRFAADSAGQVS